ncbi:hypothetical protein OG426_53730 [Streptomyces canus]|uniref:hypothetical protein n=1 Tax=Streptomyces canus TaxID=58343 RepID=UPI00225A6557|nr:hypothetical protein [Streptomyces canus]MCX4853887.1 hypothetical protein [Streptomyces canus]WSW40648.1 hypothetical protein OG426_53730 [Streptomyces canus]
MLPVFGVLGVLGVLGLPTPGEVPPVPEPVPVPVSLPQAVAADDTSRAAAATITGRRSQEDVRRVDVVVRMACSSDNPSQLPRRGCAKCRTDQYLWAVRHSPRATYVD